MRWHPLDIPVFLLADYREWRRKRNMQRWKRYIAHLARKQDRKIARVLHD